MQVGVTKHEFHTKVARQMARHFRAQISGTSSGTCPKKSGTFSGTDSGTCPKKSGTISGTRRGALSGTLLGTSANRRMELPTRFLRTPGSVLRVAGIRASDDAREQRIMGF